MVCGRGDEEVTSSEQQHKAPFKKMMINLSKRRIYIK